MNVRGIDSIESPPTTGRAIPAAVMSAPVVLAYSRGNSWLTIVPYSAARPDLAEKGWIVSIALAASGQGLLVPKGKVGRCGDFEPGGIRNSQVDEFMHNADRTWGIPWLYTYASNGAALMAEAARWGYAPGVDYFYWSAHPGPGLHICGPDAFGPGRSCGYPQAHNTQCGYAPGNCDVSIIDTLTLPGAKPPTPEPTTPKGAVMVAEAKNADGRRERFTALASGQIKHIWEEPAAAGGGYNWHGKEGVAAHYWEDLGTVGGTPIGIAAGRDESGRLSVVVKLADGTAKESWQLTPGGAWNGSQPGRNASWEPFGEPGA